MLIPLIVGVVVPFRSPLAFDYGENACEYAKGEACLPFFTRVFGPNAAGGKFTLPYTFDVFALGAGVEAVFFVIRACLLALIDLDYMMKCTVAAIILYIPAIAVAATVQGGQAISYFVAMYVPQFVLIICFTVRLEILIRRILSGQQGTWTTETVKKSSMASRSIKYHSDM